MRDGYVQFLQVGELELGDDIWTSEIDMITIARLLYLRERKHYQFKRDAECYRCSRPLIVDVTFNTDAANKKIDEVFADEIAGMQDDDD